MNRYTLTAFLTGITLLIVCSPFTTGYALTNGAAKTEPIRGKIEMDLPDASTPKVVINLDKTFFNLLINFGIGSIPKSTGDEPIVATEYAEMLKGAAIRAYDKGTQDLNQIMAHYQSALEAEKWEHIVKVKDEFDLSLLYGEEPGIIHGIFLKITNEEGSGFVNIYGEIDFQKLGVLFGRVMASSSEEGMSKTIRDLVNTSNFQWWSAENTPEKSEETPKSETETNNHSK